MIKETEIQLLNFQQLRAQQVIYRIVDIMGRDHASSSNEYVWDASSTDADNNETIIKLDAYETGRYIRRTDFDSSYTPSEVDDAVDKVINRPFFTAVSQSNTSIGNSANPSTLVGLYLVEPTSLFSVDTPLGAIKNDSGRNIPLMLGTLALQTIQTSGGSPMTVHVYSETSLDGISWTPNPINLRRKTLADNATDFWSMPSGMIDWQAGWYVRFRIYTDDIGTMTIVEPTSTADGNNLSGLSVVWEMRERR